MDLNVFSREVRFPARAEPEWSKLVERWYQMDAAAYTLTETYWQHRQALDTHMPETLILASPGGSNLTDSQFALTQSSPAKFVHTLPNIRSAALLQVMNWSGEVLCVQSDPQTMLAGLDEAIARVEDGDGPSWVASVTGRDQSFTGYILVVGAGGGLKIEKNRGAALPTSQGHDTELVSWLNRVEHETSGAAFAVFGYALSAGPGVEL